MVTFAESFETAFRDYVTLGVPASGPHEPIKSEIRAIGKLLDQQISGAVAGLRFYATKAAMDADTTRPVGTLAYVFADPVADNNRVYHYEAGGWVIDLGYANAVVAVVQPRIDAALARIQGAPQMIDDFVGNLSYEPDAAGRLQSYRLVNGEAHEVGLPHGLSRQELLRSGVSSQALLPSDYKPLAAPIPPAGRYVWAGLARDLRADPLATSITGYVFQWPPDPVPASQVRRARGTVGSQTWALDTITVAVGPCTDFFRVHQYRDLSSFRDRKTGAIYHLVNSIGRAVDAYAGTHFAISKSTNGTDFTLLGYVEAPFPTMQVWSPEAFCEPQTGQMHVIVSMNTYVENYNNNPSAAEAQANPGNLLNSRWGYHMYRVIDLDAARCDYVGKLEGSAFPKLSAGINAGHDSMIDPFINRFNGVYHAFWKAEAARDNPSLSVNGSQVPNGTLGWAAATSMLGPYDRGGAFRLSDGSFIRGEGPAVIELPSGSPLRYRVTFDDFLNLYGGGTAYADTDDFLSFPNGVQPLGVPSPYNRHATFVIGL